VAGFAGRVTAVIRLARPRYLSIMVTPFVIAFLASDSGDYAYLALGTVAVVLYQGVTSIGNCVSDELEDRHDYPQRTSLCEQVGYHQLRLVVSGISLTYLAIVVVMATALDIQLDTIGLWALYLFGTLMYSFARVKTRTMGPPILLGSLSAALAWVGFWGFQDAFSWAEDLHLLALVELEPGELFTGPMTVIAPTILALWLFGGSLCGSKDVPNLEGDALIGYESVYLKIVKGPYALVRVVAVMSLPYLLVLAFVAAGYDQPAPWVLAGYPLAIAFAMVLVRAQEQTERELVRECGYVYWQIFMSLVLFSIEPNLLAAAILTGSFAWWFLNSRFLHPDPTLVRFENALTVGNLVRRVPA
jgi:hypothetical protein